MLKQTIDILTNCKKPKKVCSMGNVAIARGAIEAGVCGVFSYPGTPSTEISEVFNFVNEFQGKKENQEQYPQQTQHPIYFEYSINEKIALEKAIAYSIGNKSAMCVMKNVGMNVASDALMSIAYQTIVAPLVIVVCDDPGCHSSSNEQDSRYWGQMASVPVFDPSTPAEALDMMKQAFKLSEEIKLPVIVRTTTRVSHSRSIFSYGSIKQENRIAGFDRLPEHINIPARTAASHVRLLGKLKHKKVLELLAKNSRFPLKKNRSKLGIICSGVSTAYINEILHQNKAAAKVNVLDLGMIYPFPEKQILDFLKKNFKRLLVLEELDPFIENAIRTLAQKNKIRTEILGKGFSGLLTTGEFSIDLITNVLENLLKEKLNKNKNLPLENSEKFLQNLPPRPPALCAGCPHRATFYLLKLAIPRDQSELILCGDIGCFGLGALPPLRMIDTINHMGMSISMAQGLYESFHSSQKDKKLVALLGDGTFFHSGLSSLVNAVYTRANILVVIFDNRTIGMTGHQSHPGASRLPKYHELDISQVIKGLGVEVVETINPFDIRDGFERLNRAMAYHGVSVVISKAPCIFLPDFKEKMDKKMTITVDPDLCNNCGNHEDHDLACSRCYAPKNNLSRAKAKLMADYSIPADEQLCPANICNHGFFNSILEGDYKSAVEIVRDKMLFARTCGDICHRPCELFSKRQNVVPIKDLKKFVSSFDEYFNDFSIPKFRIKNAAKKNKSVAIVGAGPAGLSAAYDLLQAGYDVSIYEKESKAGGMVTYAIPYFRMDKKGFAYEAMQLKDMGATFHFNTSLGKEITLEKLSSQYHAVVLAIGLNKSKILDIIEKTVPSEKRTDALSFLKSFNLKENKLKGDSTILIIGGGNSAIDAARSAKKLNSKNNIILSCIETKETMPAFAEEIKDTEEEGIKIIADSYVDSLSVDGKINIRLHSFGNKKHLLDLSCDFIIAAIGQTTETSLLSSLSLDENIRVKSKNSFTGYKNILVAGDISAGNSMSVIGAIASGKKAAVGVRHLLEEYRFEYEGSKAMERLNENPSADIAHSISITDKNVREVVEQFNLFQSCYKCNHCIDNFGCPALVKVNGKIQVDYARCTLCGLCIDVCPNNAIKWETVKTEEQVLVEVK